MSSDHEMLHDLSGHKCHQHQNKSVKTASGQEEIDEADHLWPSKDHALSKL